MKDLESTLGNLNKNEKRLIEIKKSRVELEEKMGELKDPVEIEKIKKQIDALHEEKAGIISNFIKTVPETPFEDVPSESEKVGVEKNKKERLPPKLSFEQLKEKISKGEIIIDPNKFSVIKADILENKNGKLVKERENLLKQLSEKQKYDKKELYNSLEFRKSLNLESKKDKNDLIDGKTLSEYIMQMAGKEVQKEDRYPEIKERLKNIKLYKEEEINEMSYIEYMKKYEVIIIEEENPAQETVEQPETQNITEESEPVVTNEEEAEKQKQVKLEQEKMKRINAAFDNFVKITQNYQKLKQEHGELENKLNELIELREKLLKESESSKIEREITIEELAEILKNNKIDQIIVASSYNKNKELARLNPDLDSRGALYLLNSLNKKPINNTYADGSMSSVVGKRGEGKESVLKNTNEFSPLSINENGIKKDNEGEKTIENKPGLKIFIDTGGEWLKIEENGEEKVLYIDHHGSGKREPTSGTKMIYRAMEEAVILENKPWVKKLVRFINDTDNLSYVDEKDKFGKRIFTETNFKENWPRSLYALAEDYIPFNKLVELFEKGTIKDPSKPFTKEELEGEIGKIETTEMGHKKPLKDIVEEIEKKVIENVESVKRIRNYNSKVEKLNTNSKNLGKIIYHNFKCKYKDPDDETKLKTSIIDDKMSFKAIKAMNADTYVVWNKTKDKKSFFINSKDADLVEIAKRLNEEDPGCAKEVRGVFIFGKINKLSERKFLEILDPEIIKDAKLK
ncbi:MAG: hypothetical protein WCT42_00360 [Candidatus Paceibacterota bacterium]